MKENSIGVFEPIDIEASHERVLFEFTHVPEGGKERRLAVWYKPTSRAHWEIDDTAIIARFEVSIANTPSDIIGKSGGYITKNEPDGSIEFRALASYNYSRPLRARNPNIPYIPRLVGATIAELVHRGFVQQWYSDDKESLSRMAKKMYRKYLLKDPRLIVTPPRKNAENRYLVRARTTV